MLSNSRPLVLQTIWCMTFLSLAVSFSSLAQVEDDDFDEIDKLLDAQFESTDQRIEDRFKRVEEAIEKAFNGVTRKIEVNWGDDSKLPSKTAWVNYTEDLQTRTILDYEQGEMIIETIISDDTSPDVQLQELIDTAKSTASLTKADMASQDIFQIAVEEELNAQGITTSASENETSDEDFIKALLPTEQQSTLESDAFLLATIAQVAAQQAEQSLDMETQSQETPSTTVEAEAIDNKLPQESLAAEANLITLNEETEAGAESAPTIQSETKQPETRQPETAVTETKAVGVTATVPESGTSPSNSEQLSLKQEMQTQRTQNANSTEEKQAISESSTGPIPPVELNADNNQQSDLPSATETNQSHASPPEPMTAILTEKPAVTEVVTSPEQEQTEVQKAASRVASDICKEASPCVEVTTENGVTKMRLSIDFVNNFQKILLEKNLDTINKFSDEYKIPVSTLLAIIETESSYNPRARSAIPAFGLMQLVPRTAGIDAYNFVYGEKKVLAPDYLYVEENNLELGSAYFHILMNRYLKGVTDPDSRFYCAIASYNTGVGNVAKTFTGKKSIRSAVPVINAMQPDEVLDFLLQNLVATETKNYLKKIISRRQKYLHMDNEV